MGLRDQILAAQDLEFETVDVSEWGLSDLIVSELTALDENELGAEQLAMQEEGKVSTVNYQARVLARSLRDPEFNLIFDPTNPEEVLDLGRKSPKVIDRLYEIVARLSGLMDEEDEAGESGNSDASTSDDSPTD